MKSRVHVEPRAKRVIRGDARPVKSEFEFEKEREESNPGLTQVMDCPWDCPTRRLDQFSADPHPGAITVCVLPHIAGADHATRRPRVRYLFFIND